MWACPDADRAQKHGMDDFISANPCNFDHASLFELVQRLTLDHRLNDSYSCLVRKHHIVIFIAVILSPMVDKIRSSSIVFRNLDWDLCTWVFNISCLEVNGCHIARKHTNNQNQIYLVQYTILQDKHNTNSCTYVCKHKYEYWEPVRTNSTLSTLNIYVYI